MVAGGVVDESGLAVAAKVALKARAPNEVDLFEFKDVSSVVSDPDQGFRFEDVFLGPFTVTASSFFAPEATTASGVLTVGEPAVEDLVLTLAKNTATLRGCVLDPEGETIAPILGSEAVPLPVSVFITSGALRSDLSEDTQNPEPDGIRVDASEGCFVSSIPLPPDHYTIRVTDEWTGSPTLGLTGEAYTDLDRGEDGEQDVRLLGLGTLLVEVVDSSGAALPGVDVTVQRGSYPRDQRETLLVVATDVQPARFEGLTEGPVSVSAVVSTDPRSTSAGATSCAGLADRSQALSSAWPRGRCRW